jgi:hypothetical protein
MASRSRICIAASSAVNKSKRFSTSAQTWGELKGDSNLSGLISGNVEVILNPGSVTLSRDEAELPAGDFKLYIIPTKNKAGMTGGDAAALGEQIAEAIRKGAKIASSSEVTGLKDQLIADIEDFFGVDLSDEACAECDKTLEEARNLE